MKRDVIRVNEVIINVGNVELVKNEGAELVFYFVSGLTDRVKCASAEEAQKIFERVDLATEAISVGD